MENLKPIKMLIIYGYVSVIILLLISIFWYIIGGGVYAILFAIVFIAISPMRHLVLGSFASISFDENTILVKTYRTTISIPLDENILSYSIKYTKRQRVEAVEIKGTDKLYKFNVSIFKRLEVDRLIDFIDSKYTVADNH